MPKNKTLPLFLNETKILIIAELVTTFAMAIKKISEEEGKPLEPDFQKKLYSETLDLLQDIKYLSEKFQSQQ